MPLSSTETLFGRQPWGTVNRYSRDKKMLYMSQVDHSVDRTGKPLHARSHGASMEQRRQPPLDHREYNGHDDWGRYVAERDSKHVPDRDQLTKAQRDEHHRDSIRLEASRHHGVLFSETKQPCMVCYENTIELFPCDGAHPYCINCRKTAEDNDTEQCPQCREDGRYDPSIYAEGKGGWNRFAGGRKGREDPPWYDQMFLSYVNPKLAQLKKVSPKDKWAMSQLSEDDQATVEDLQKVAEQDMKAMSDVLCAPCDISTGMAEEDGCYCIDPRQMVETQPGVWKNGDCKCNMRTMHREYLHSAAVVQVCERNSQQFWDPLSLNRYPFANLRAKIRWKKAMLAERELKQGLRLNGLEYAASQDQGVEIAFNEMRNAIYGWLLFYNRMFAMLNLEEAQKKVQERLEVAIIHPMEHTILMPGQGLELGAMVNGDKLMTEKKEGYEAGGVDWNPIVRDMISDLMTDNAWWRQDNDKRWWRRHGCDKARPLSTAPVGQIRPSIHDVWTAGSDPKYAPLKRVQLYREEVDQIIELVKNLDKDSPEKRAAAGFGSGPAVLIDFKKKRREFMIEAEGRLSDNTGRWVNASFKEAMHPAYMNEFPELVLHVGEQERTNGPITWHVVRRENLSIWIMPQGDGEPGIEGAALPAVLIGERRRSAIPVPLSCPPEDLALAD